MTADNVQGAPDLIVEVLSESTRKRDIGAKLRLYACYGVAYYWIVDPDAGTVQPYTREERGCRAEAVLSQGQRLTCPLFLDMPIDVAAIFE